MDTDHVSILLDIKTEIGALSARMMDAAHSRQRMEASIDQLKNTVSEIKPVIADVAQIKPDIDELMKFKARIGSYLWIGGMVATGTLYLLWQGIMYFSDNIKAALGRLFH